jgi:hypothetical protein
MRLVCGLEDAHLSSSVTQSLDEAFHLSDYLVPIVTFRSPEERSNNSTLCINDGLGISGRRTSQAWKYM